MDASSKAYDDELQARERAYAARLRSDALDGIESQQLQALRQGPRRPDAIEALVGGIARDALRVGVATYAYKSGALGALFQIAERVDGIAKVADAVKDVADKIGLPAPEKIMKAAKLGNPFSMRAPSPMGR